MSKSKRPVYYCTVSIILVFLMAFLLPIQVFAETTPEPKPEESVTFDSLGEATDNANIVSELKERRDEYTKHFRMDDGTIMAVTFDCPVHYKNDKGKWVEYDNSLIAESEATPDEITPEPLTNKKSNINIELAPDTKTDNLVKIDSKKGNITWKYTGAKQSNAKVKNNNKKHRGNAKFTSIDKLTSQASYKSIYNNVDLDCIVSTTGVKENIILENADAQNEFEIEYNIKGLKAKQIDNRTIKLYKGKKEVYSITAPCMYDADGNTSSDLSFEIISNKSNVLKVKLTADRGFLNSWGRAYPVTIDPEVSFYGSQNTESVYINEYSPNTNYSSNNILYVGTEGSNNYSSLIKCKNIEQTYMNKQIVSAKLQMSQAKLNEDVSIDVYPITSDWTSSSATYNNVSTDTSVIDYVSYPAGRTKPICFDITKIFKKWVEHNMSNNGVCLAEDGPKMIFGNHQAYLDCYKPTFYVKYKDYTGLESNLTSHTVPCGQDAVLSVCDYTGSLSVRQNFFEENTARLPLSIFATYHSARNAINEQTGYGWHYSFNQTISEDDNYYKYIDENGVDLYFKKEGEDVDLSDEDDAGYTLTKDNNTIKIDNDSITKTFEIVDDSGIYKLKNEKSNDNENNTINYIYNTAGYLTKITTSLGDYDIYRAAEHRIGNIKTPNNKYMYLVYYGGTSKIARFTAVDGKATTFNYESYSDESRLKEIRYHNENGSQTGGGAICNYNDDNKVSSITELGKNGASRKALSVTYNDDNTTEFKEIANNNKKETYTFDNYGNTVSVLNANGMLTNANDSSSLSINTGSDSYTKNYIEESNEPNGIGNQQGDGLYFYKGNGIIGNQTSSGGQVTLDSETYLLGHNSIKVNHSGDSQIYTYAMHENNIGTLAGKTVTLSAYVKLSNITAGNLSGGAGAIVKFKCLNGNTTLSDKNSIALTQTVKGSEWERLSLTVSIPQATTKFRMYFGIRNAQGTAWFDCMQLEEGSVANDYNALSNSDFSSTNNWKTQDDNSITVNNQKAIINGSGGEPAPTEETTATEEPTSATEEATSSTYTRTETETISNDVIKETDAYGNVVKTELGLVTRTYERTYEVTGSNSSSEPEEPEDEGEEESEEKTNCNNYIYQEVDVNKNNVSFVISGSAQAKSVPLNNEYRTFGIALKIKYEDDNDYSEDHYQAFNAYTDSMQNVTLSVTPNNSDKSVEKVAFAFVYGYNKNIMTIKNAMLNYAYNGTNKESSTEPETTEPETTDPDSTELPTTSDPENNNPTESNPGELIDEEITTESVNTDEEYMRNESVYDDDGNYIKKEIDEAGNTTEYNRDHDGNATKITDGKGHSTSYSYDVHNNLTSVSQGNSSNSYTYNTYNELSKITHNGFDYNYTYNNYGEPTSIKVGSQALITYEYNSNGNVTKATYGNGDYLDYTYDDYARITKVKLNNTSTLATYVYNKKNQVTKFTDGKSGETTEYCYDCQGNVLYKYLISSDGSLLRLVEGDTEKTSINGSERTITNVTDDDGKSYVQNGNAKITSSTDDFGRTSKVTTSIKNGNDFVDKFNLNYTYKTVGETNRTTKNVGEMTYKLGDGENATQIAKYKYSYDSNGNITEVWDGNNKIAKYQYDSLNQIKVAWDYQQNLKFTYTYDNSGNISGATNQALDPRYGEDYTVGSPHSIDYYYNDSSWGDLLTSLNSTSLSYDNIGNPTSYRDGMTMTWSGRELKSLNKSGYTYNFTYNLDGLRTRRIKTQGNTILDDVNYYYDDSKNLIGLKKGETTVLFYYDFEGKVYSMTKGDDTYFFIKNLQGDVTKIIDENGNTCATYAYDAWGALLAENEDSSVEGFNPFRYRSYVYDSETELYYLQSRYYDPKTGRFINADSPEYTDTDSDSPLSTNMFAYCENNAVNKIDKNGNRTINVAGQSYTYKYNRDKAIEYAKKYYYVFDILIWTIGYNIQYKYYHGNDCANFVSQCLHYAGVPMTKLWYSQKYEKTYHGDYTKTTFIVSKAWRLVLSQKSYLEKYLAKKKNIVIKNTKKWKKILKAKVKAKKIKKGDVLYFSDNGKKYIHAAIISKVNRKKGIIMYAAHSVSRFNQKLDDYFKNKPKCKICIVRMKG